MKYCFIFLILSGTCLAYGQSISSDNLNRIADDLLATDIDEENADLEERYENLALLIANPLDLNRVSEDELRQLFILSDNQIRQFVNYRNTQGKLLSVYELQTIPDFDTNTVALLLPLVRVVDENTVVNKSTLQRMFSKGNSYMITRVETTLEKKVGFYSSTDSTARYLGSRPKAFMRFRSAVPHDYSLGVTLEKDAGERISWDARKTKFLGDYSSAHLQLLNKGKLKNVILGDYQAQFAQGVVLGGAFGLGKSAETITSVKRVSLGFLPHTSGAESGFYRGGALTLQMNKKLSLSMFISNIKRDATLNEMETSTTISSFRYSGFHRNTNEQANEKNVREITGGTVLHYRVGSLEVGIIAQAITFDFPIRKSDNVYNQFTFSGKSNFNGSVFYNYTFNNISLFAEWAKSHKGGHAIVSGLLASLTTAFDVSMVVRHYAKNYYSFYANPFSENTQQQNETGIYWGFKYKWSRKFNVAGYVDLFRFPWLGLRRYAPSTGSEWLSRLTYQPSRKLLLFAQIRQEKKVRNTAEETMQYSLAEGIKMNYMGSMNYSEGILKMRTRVQYSTYHFNGRKSDGMVLLQGVGFEIGRFQLMGHYALFQTDDFDNRQYVYENDVYLAFSLPSYDGQGVRSMIMCEFKASKNLTLYIRHARSYYDNEQEIGTGLEKISGNTKNDLKFQAVLRF